VKYGITNAYVLALEAVLPSGEVIHTGARVLKNSTGYNLTQLLTGSEGTLAVITQITLRLVPKPKLARTMLAPFAKAEDACLAVSAVFRAGLTPATLEFMEADAIVFGQKYLNINRYSVDGIEGHLLIEFDGNDNAALLADCETCLTVLEDHHAGEVLFAEGAEQQAELWRIRRCLGEAVKGTTIYKEEDTVVPRAELARLLAFVKEVGREFGFYSVCYGHAGDGNLHVNILKGELSDHAWEHELPKAIRRIFEFVVSLGGTLSGEHGIGWVQRGYLDVRFSPTELALLRGIKQVFDPKGILNPGKILP
jgi:glycolate oxidase